MPRVFAYCRVSTTDQTTENQKLEIVAAGFAIEARRLVDESISGSVAAKERPGFIKLIDRMESGDVLVVTKLDLISDHCVVFIDHRHHPETQQRQQSGARVQIPLPIS